MKFNLIGGCSTSFLRISRFLIEDGMRRRMSIRSHKAFVVNHNILNSINNTDLDEFISLSITR